MERTKYGTLMLEEVISIHLTSICRLVPYAMAPLEESNEMS
jgi:hypothetical protein